jgi:hypothetical protein
MEKHEQFKNLVERKFGKSRGYIGAAAIKLQINQSNLSAMMRGKIGIPDKYTESLNALPDFAPPVGVEMKYDSDVNQMFYHFTTVLTPKARKSLEMVARLHNAGNEFVMPDLSQSQDVTAAFFEKMVTRYEELLRDRHPEAYDTVLQVVAEEKAESKRQLNLELQDRKHLVADELRDGELEEDPLA